MFVCRKLRFPTFFTLSSEDNLAPKLEWLSSHASNKVVRRVLFRHPSLLGHNADGNLAPKVRSVHPTNPQTLSTFGGRQVHMHMHMRNLGAVYFFFFVFCLLRHDHIYGRPTPRGES